MIVTLTEAKDYLGESGTASDGIITSMIAAAEEELTRATGVAWAGQSNNHVAREACMLIIWQSFMAARDAAKNTEFVERRLTRLITQLQYGGEQSAEI